MDINVPFEEIRKRSLMIAVPMYGGKCDGIFAKSMLDLTSKLTAHGIKHAHYFLFNESLIPRARNYCVDEFMRSDFTHFMFIDSDIAFNPDDVIAMLAIQGEDSPYDVLTAAYPKKTIAWEKIKHAVDKGFADDNPSELENFVGDFVFNPKAGTSSIPISEPAEVLEAGTGFMMVRRKTFEIFAEKFPQYAYRPDHVRTAAFDGSRKIHMYFQSEIDPKSERYLSEDYWFCQKIQELGLKVWMCPWMRLAHQGSFVFGGSLAHMAALGVSATADQSMIAKMTKKDKEAIETQEKTKQKRKN
jgi:hypothetical protein